MFRTWLPFAVLVLLGAAPPSARNPLQRLLDRPRADPRARLESINRVLDDAALARRLGLWREQLEKRTGEPIELVGFLQKLVRLDVIFQGNEVVPARARALALRCEQVDAKTLDVFSRAVHALLGPHTSRLAVLLRLAEMEPLFTKDGLDRARVDALRKRLQATPRTVVVDLAATVEIPLGDALLVLLRLDALYRGDVFQTDLFARWVKPLRRANGKSR